MIFQEMLEFEQIVNLVTSANGNVCSAKDEVAYRSCQRISSITEESVQFTPPMQSRVK